MAAIISFMDSPLVTWVMTFSEDHDTVDFQELCDAVFLNDVMAQIDHRDLDLYNDVKRVPKDSNAKIQNWSVLIRNIRNYYQDVLQQLVVMETQDIVAMVKEPTKESSLAHMEKVLLLLLGCAVQCDHKEDYINSIKSLDIHIQQVMVAYIQEITDNNENVLPLELDDGGGDLAGKQLYGIIRNIVQERDSLAQRLLPLTQERDYYKHELIDKHGRPLTPPVYLEKYHLFKELNDWKQKSNKLMEEIEDKSKLMTDLQEDLDLIKGQYLQAKSENVLLSKDAKSVQAYRDELDILRDKVVKIERYEKDIHKYKERLGELDFYKSRVEELRKDNDSLAESRSHLDEQYTASQKKLDSVMDELVRCQIQAEESSVEKDRLNKKLQEVVEENSVLEFEKSKISEGYGSSGIRRILSISSMDLGSQHNVGGTLSDELQVTMSSQVTRLEMEKDELRQELEDAKHRLNDAQHMLQKVQMETEKEIRSKVVELEHQTKRLRTQNVKSLAEDYHQKIEEIEKRSVDLKQKMSDEFKGRLSQLEKEKQELRTRESEHHRKLKFIQDAWQNDREKCVQLDRTIQELSMEKDQFKERIRMIQENSSEKIQELQSQVQQVQNDSDRIQRQSIRVCNLCDKEINRDNVDYAARAAELESMRLNGMHTYHSDPDREIVTITRSINAHESPDKEIAEKCVQTSPPPAWISYSEDDEERLALETNNNKSKSKSGSKSKFFDILRPKSSRQGSPAPHRPATVLGVVDENRVSTPKGVVTPQRRSVPNTPGSMSDGGFRRGDRLRSTIQHSGSFRERGQPQRPSSDYMPFSRSDRLRSTMPEKKTVYVTPERRQHLTPAGSRSSISSIESVKSSRHRSFDYDCFPLPPDLDLQPERISEKSDYDKDSGCPTSPDTPLEGVEVPHTPTKDPHWLTSFKVISSEMVKTQIRTSSLPRMGEKWKALVEKIVELQDKNQQLSLDNSKLRKSLNSIKFSNDRIDLLEKRNLDIEVENRKLRKIIESLQSSFGDNPYDKRTYHFYSNV